MKPCTPVGTPAASTHRWFDTPNWHANCKSCWISSSRNTVCVFAIRKKGSELDLDVAIRSLIDWRAGSKPDPRILMRPHTDGRSIAVLVLLDLSQSLNDSVPGTGQTQLALSQEAVTLLERLTKLFLSLTR